MVSEAEFDKNQKAFRDAQLAQPAGSSPPQAQTTEPLQIISDTGNAISDFFEVPPHQRTGDGLPDIPAILGGKSSDEVSPEERLWLSAGVATSPAASAAYNAVFSSGLPKHVASKAARQAAAMVRNGVPLADAVDKATFFQVMGHLGKDPASKKLASVVAHKATQLLATPATKPTPATTANVLTELAGVIQRHPLASTAGTLVLGISFSLFNDWKRGALGLTDVGARAAQEFYINGAWTEQKMRAELDSRGYSDDAITVYVSSAEREKAGVDYLNEIAADIPGVSNELLGDEDRMAVADVVRKKLIEANQAQAAAQTPEALSQAQLQRVQQEFTQGRTAGEVERQKQESLQKKPPTVAELTKLPPGQLTPTEQEKIIKAKTPNEEPSAVQAAKPKPAPEEEAAKASLLGGFSRICPPGFIWDHGLKRCVPDTGVSRL